MTWSNPEIEGLILGILSSALNNSWRRPLSRQQFTM